MRYAIVQSGGKQYRAVEGGTIEVDHLNVQIGARVKLEDVLLVVEGDQVAVGTPTVGGVSVEATVVDQVKGPRVVVFKYRPSKRYRRKMGHRQKYTRLQIEKIATDS